MNILIITTLFPSVASAGQIISTAVRDLATALPKHSMETEVSVKVLVPVPRFRFSCLGVKYTEIDITEEFEGIQIRSKAFWNLPKGYFLLAPNDYKFFSSYLTSVDVIVSHMPLGGLIASALTKRFKIPRVHVVHGTDTLYPWFLKRYTKNAKIVAARSLHLQRKVRALGINCSHIAFSGIDEHEIIERTRPVPYTLKSQYEIRFVSVCNLVPLKNIDIVLQTLAKLPAELSWNYQIIGDGPQAERLKQLTNDLGLNQRVEFLGRKERNYCLEVMRTSDVFLMPSAPETFGLAFLEAMAAGCLVIGAKGWGIDGVVSNGENGYLVTPRDTDDLTSAILDLISNDPAGMYSASYKTISSHTSTHAAANYLRIIAQAI